MRSASGTRRAQRIIRPAGSANRFSPYTFFGRRPYETGDQSRNLAWLSLFTFGEAWHNNHHAFPTSARHGLQRWQLDPSSGVIWLLERLGLARDVVRVSPDRRRRKLASD